MTAETALLHSMIQRIGEKLPVYSGSSPASFEIDAVVRQNATALIEMSLFQPKETLNGLVGLLEDVSRPTLAGPDTHDPDNRYLSSQYVILKLINECLFLHTKHWQPELSKRFQIFEQIGFLQRSKASRRERNQELQDVNIGSYNTSHVPAVSLDESILKYLFIVCSRLLVTTSTTINPDMLTHSYGDPLLLSQYPTDISGDCQKLVGQVVCFVSTVNWPLVFQRVKARLHFLSQGSPGTNTSPEPNIAGKVISAPIGAVVRGAVTITGTPHYSSTVLSGENELLGLNSGTNSVARAGGISLSNSDLTGGTSSDDTFLFPENTSGNNSSSGSVGTFGDLTEIRLIEFIHLNDEQLKMLLYEAAQTVRNMKRAAQTQLAISLRPAIWNWIQMYPAQFSQLCAERKRLDASAELLFEFFNGMGDNFRRKQIFWPTQTMLLATCQNVVSDYVTNAEIRSARGLTALATISGSSSQSKRAQFLTDLRKNLKNSKLSDIALICMLEFVKASTYSLDAENSVMKAWVVSIEAELKEKMLEAGRQANLTTGTSKVDSENQFDPRLLADFFSCSWKLNPTSFIRFLVPLIVSENAPVIFQKALAKGCLSAVGNANNGIVLLSDARLASFLRQLFIDNRERVLAEPSSNKRNLSIVRSVSPQNAALGNLVGGVAGSIIGGAIGSLPSGGSSKLTPAGVPVTSGIASVGELSGRLSSVSLGQANSSLSFAVYIHPNKMWQLSLDEISERVDVSRYILTLWRHVPTLIVERESFGLLSADHLKMILSHLVLCVFELNSDIRQSAADSVRQLFHPSFVSVWGSLELASQSNTSSGGAAHGASTGLGSDFAGERQNARLGSNIFSLFDKDDNVKATIKSVWELSTYVILSIIRGLLKLDVSFFPGTLNMSNSMGSSAASGSSSSGSGSTFSSVHAYQQYNEFVKHTMHLIHDLLQSRNQYIKLCGKSAKCLRHVTDRSLLSIFVEACTLIQICSSDYETTAAVVQCLEASIEECVLLGEVLHDVCDPTNYTRFAVASRKLSRQLQPRSGDNVDARSNIGVRANGSEALLDHATAEAALKSFHDRTANSEQPGSAKSENCSVNAVLAGPILEFNHGKELSGSTLSSLSPTLHSSDSLNPTDSSTGEPMSFLENLSVYANLVSNFQSSKNLVTGQKALQKSLRRILREADSFSPGLCLGWIELHRRWTQSVYWILKPELHKEMVLRAFGEDLILSAAERESNKKRNFASSMSKASASQSLEKAVQQIHIDPFEDKGEWHNFAGVLCVLAGVLNEGLKQVLGNSAGFSGNAPGSANTSVQTQAGQPANGATASQQSPMNNMSSTASNSPAPGTNSAANIITSSFGAVLGSSVFANGSYSGQAPIPTFAGYGAGGVGGNNVLVGSNNVPIANFVDLAISANQADVQLLYAYARSKLETFVMDLVDLALCEHVVVREAMKETLGNDLCPNLLNLLLSCIHINVMNMCEPGGEVLVSQRNTMIVDNLISILKLILDRAHKCSDNLLSTDLGSLLQNFIKYAARIPESPGGAQMRVRIKLCQLVDTLIQQREYVPLRQDVKLRNFVVQTFMEWTNVFNMVSEEAVVEDIIVNKSGISGGREITLAVLRCFVNVTHKMPLYVADSERGPIMDTLETRTKLFVKIFSFHMKLLRVCQLLESRLVSDGSINSKEAIAFAAHVREFSILVLSNVISANVDVGIKYSLAMGYSDDTMTKAAFMQIFKNLLNQDTEFEGLNDGTKELLQAKYEKMIDILAEPGLEIVLALLETVQNQNAIDDLVSTLYNVFSGRNLTILLLKGVIQREIQKTDSPSTLFRRNSAATKLLTLFARTFGFEFLRQTLKVPLQFLLEYSKGTSFEIDPSRLPPDANLKTNTAALNLATQTFIDSILASSPKFPEQLREICHFINISVAEKYPSSSTIAVGGFVILRFFNPAITSPDHFSLVANANFNSREIRRALVLISKVIQNLANNVLFGVKEPFMASLNGIVTNNRDRVTDFLQKISNPVTGGLASDEVGQGKGVEQIDCIRIHRFLKHYMEAIEQSLLAQRRHFAGHNLVELNTSPPKDRQGTERGFTSRDTPPPNFASGTSVNTSALNPASNIGLAQNATNVASLTSNSIIGSKLESTERNQTLDSDDALPRKGVLARMNALLQQMGPPQDIPLDLTGAKTAASATSAERSGQLYREFMNRFRTRNLDDFVAKQILYEGVGLSKQRLPVIYFIASRVQRQYFDSELLLYFVLKVLETLATKQFEMVLDLTGFAAENEFGSDWYVQFFKLLPTEIISLMDTLYVLNPSQYARAFVKKQQRMMLPDTGNNIRKIVFASAVAELYEFIAASDLQVPKSTLNLDKDVVTFSPVTRLLSMHTRVSVILKINGDHMQCTTVKKQDFCGQQVGLNDVVEIANIEDVHFTSRHDEFIVKCAGGRVVMTFASPKRDVIVKHLRAAKARQQFSDKPQLAVERVLHPNDVPGTLLNIALLNLSSGDAVLRISAYELLQALCLFFSFDTGKMVMYANGLCVPTNIIVFACELSKWLAQAEPQLSLEFLTEFLVGFSRSNTQTQQFALEYLTPWLPHLFPYIRLLHATQGSFGKKSSSNNVLSGAVLASLTSSGQGVSASAVTGSPNNASPTTASPQSASPTHTQSPTALNVYGASSSISSNAAGLPVGGSSANPHDIEIDARSLLKAEHIMRGFVDITVRAFSTSALLLQAKLWAELARGSSDTIPYIVDLFVTKLVDMGVESQHSEAILYMLVTVAHKSRQLVSGRIVSRLRLAISGTASVPTHSPVQHPAWREISALVRCTLVLSFNNLINVVEYMPDIVYIVTELAGIGSPLICHSIHGIVINTCQTFCSTMPAGDPKLHALRGLLAELSEPKYCFVFGLVTRTVGSGSGPNSTMILGANAFVKTRSENLAAAQQTVSGSYSSLSGLNEIGSGASLGNMMHVSPSSSNISSLANTGHVSAIMGSNSSNSALSSGVTNALGQASGNRDLNSAKLLAGNEASGLPSNGNSALTGNAYPASGAMSSNQPTTAGANTGDSSSGSSNYPGNTASLGTSTLSNLSTQQHVSAVSGIVQGSMQMGSIAAQPLAASNVAVGAFPGTSADMNSQVGFNAAEVVMSIPLNTAESIINALMEMMTLAAPSESKLLTWKARWMSFVVTSAFQFNPAIQPRAFLALGTLAQNEVDDGLVYKILVTLRGVLLIFSPEDDCRLLISIIRCLCYTVGNLSSESRYFKPMFWLAISLLQIGHVPVFQSALTLLHVVLKLLDERGVFLKEDLRMFLIKARSQIADVAYQLDATVGIHFRSHFSFALAANLMKGLKHPTTKTQTISVLMTLLEISSKAVSGRSANSIGDHIAGKLPRKPSQRGGFNANVASVATPRPSSDLVSATSPTFEAKATERRSGAAPSQNYVSDDSALGSQHATSSRVSADVVGYMIPLLPYVEKFGELFWLTGVNIDNPSNSATSNPSIGNPTRETVLGSFVGNEKDSFMASPSYSAGANKPVETSKPDDGNQALPGHSERDSNDSKKRFGVLPAGGILGKMCLTDESAILALSFIVTMLSNAENERELLVLYSLLAEAITVIPAAFTIVAPSLIPILMKALSTNQTPEVVKAIEPILIGVSTCRGTSKEPPAFDSVSLLGEIGFPGLSTCGTFRSVTKEKKVTFAQCACAVVERVL